MKIFTFILLIILTNQLPFSKKIRHLDEIAEQDGEQIQNVEDIETDIGDDEESDEEIDENELMEQDPIEMIEFQDDTQQEHLRNFKKISDDIKVFEEQYIQCLQEIPDKQFSEITIEECLGKNFGLVMLDIKYELMKIMSRGDATLRQIMIDHCYLDAGEDEVKSNACDVIERDVIPALWKGLPFHEIIAINSRKYTEIDTEIDAEVYSPLQVQIENFAAEFFELLDEVDSHKEITLIEIKKHLDDRTKIMFTPKEDPTKVIEHQVEITQLQQGEPVEEDEVQNEDLGNSQENDIEDNDEEEARKLKSKNTKILPKKIIKKNFDNKFRLFNGGKKFQGMHRVQEDKQSKSGIYRQMIERMAQKNNIGNILKNNTFKIK